MDQVMKLDVRLTKPHVQTLTAAARDANLSLQDFCQRLLQNAADGQMAMPNPIARQLAAGAAAIMNVAKEIGEARRAYEQKDGQSLELKRALDAAIVKSRQVLTGMAETQRRIA